MNHRTDVLYSQGIIASEFIPRHLRHAWVDDDGRQHVPALDDEDMTFLTTEDQERIRQDHEANERERQALIKLRRADRLAALDWWQTYVANHRPVEV